MPLDAIKLQQLLCEQLCHAIRVVRRPDGRLMLRTGFEFPDGDRFPIQVSETATNGIRLSDMGHTLMHISYGHDIDSFLLGTRRQLLEAIVSESCVSLDGGVFFVDCSLETLPDAIFRIGQTLTRVYDLTFLSQSRAESTFYDDLMNVLKSVIREDMIQIDYVPDKIPNPEVYWVDFKVEGKHDVPVFVYGVPNRDKARLSTAMLSYFHRHKVKFESILVFQDQTEIPRLDLARLSDVGGDMISSLDSVNDLRRKLLERMNM